ncbi:hypothetical protein EG329_013834 [Mollisiaceae sp. DMI_Dod_QoI]|nr:hypothetical protein EG329_013834 [Helotiales sp. DMI_Dod_QoI]
MGIPYSRQIHLAFDQVTPLVGAGFKVLQTTKNITFLLAGIQILTVLLLGCILIVLFAVLITVSPDLERERQELVTPAAKWLAGVLLNAVILLSGKWLWVCLWTMFWGAALGAAAGWYVTWEVGEKVVVEGEGTGTVTGNETVGA